MMRFSANLGFLWKELALPDAIRAAKRAGFDAVECHWPFDIDPALVRAALDETGLSMLGLNTRRGDQNGDNGLAALPLRQGAAQDAIIEALDYAREIDAAAVHIMAGAPPMGTDANAAHDIFIENLHFAASRASAQNTMLLIEPLNQHDAPGYFLQTTDQAHAIIQQIAAPHLKLMFDCYHVGRSEGDVIARLHDLVPIIGHIQFAAVPDRGAPDHGKVDYKAVFAAIEALGWDRPLGAEYRPSGPVEAGLGWMERS